MFKYKVFLVQIEKNTDQNKFRIWSLFTQNIHKYSLTSFAFSIISFNDGLCLLHTSRRIVHSFWYVLLSCPQIGLSVSAKGKPHLAVIKPSVMYPKGRKYSQMKDKISLIQKYVNTNIH